MAEDFAPFHVSITTDESVFNSVPQTSRVRCVFTITDYFSGGGKRCHGPYWVPLVKESVVCAGGVAYLGVFAQNDLPYQPAWVFSNRLGSGNEKYCAEAGSHEVGHNLNLQHDGGGGDGSYYQVPAWRVLCAQRH